MQILFAKNFPDKEPVQCLKEEEKTNYYYYRSKHINNWGLCQCLGKDSVRLFFILPSPFVVCGFFWDAKTNFLTGQHCWDHHLIWFYIWNGFYLRCYNYNVVHCNEGQYYREWKSDPSPLTHQCIDNWVFKSDLPERSTPAAMSAEHLDDLKSMHNLIKGKLKPRT